MSSVPADDACGAGEDGEAGERERRASLAGRAGPTGLALRPGLALFALRSGWTCWTLGSSRASVTLGSCWSCGSCGSGWSGRSCGSCWASVALFARRPSRTRIALLALCAGLACRAGRARRPGRTSRTRLTICPIQSRRAGYPLGTLSADLATLAGLTRHTLRALAIRPTLTRSATPTPLGSRRHSRRLIQRRPRDLFRDLPRLEPHRSATQLHDLLTQSVDLIGQPRRKFRVGRAGDLSLGGGTGHDQRRHHRKSGGDDEQQQHSGTR